MKLTTVTDVFGVEADALVNPVNCVGVSGAGLAKEFAKRFPENQEYYKRNCPLTPGKILWYLDKKATEGFWIANFPTKRHWQEKSRFFDIHTGLKSLRDGVVMLGVKSIVIPRLGCGLGGLKWKDVKPSIEGAFEGLEVEVFLVRGGAGE